MAFLKYWVTGFLTGFVRWRLTRSKSRFALHILKYLRTVLEVEKPNYFDCDVNIYFYYSIYGQYVKPLQILKSEILHTGPFRLELSKMDVKDFTLEISGNCLCL